jgi:hypothetical protein
MAATISPFVTQAIATFETISNSKRIPPIQYLGNHFIVSPTKVLDLDLSSIVVPCLIHLRIEGADLAEKRKTITIITSLSQILAEDYPYFARLLPILINYPMYQLSSRVDRLAWLVYCSELMCFERKNLSLFTMHAIHGLRKINLLESKPEGIRVKAMELKQSYHFSLPDVTTPSVVAFLFDLFGEPNEEDKVNSYEVNRFTWYKKLRKIHHYCFHEDSSISTFARQLYWAQLYDKSKNETAFYFNEFQTESDSVKRFFSHFYDQKIKDITNVICAELNEFLEVLKAKVKAFDLEKPNTKSDFLPFLDIYENYQRNQKNKFKDFSLLIKIQLEMKKACMALDQGFLKTLSSQLNKELLKDKSPIQTLRDFEDFSAFKPFNLPIEPHPDTLFEEDEDDLVARCLPQKPRLHLDDCATESSFFDHCGAGSSSMSHAVTTPQFPIGKAIILDDDPTTPPRTSSSLYSSRSSGAGTSPMSYASAASKSPPLTPKKAIAHPIFDFSFAALKSHLETNRARSHHLFSALPKFLNLSTIRLAERVTGWFSDKEYAFKIQGYTSKPKWTTSMPEERIAFQDHMEFIHTFPLEADMLQGTTYSSFIVREISARPPINEWIFALPCMVKREERLVSGIILPASNHSGWLVSVINPDTLECKHRCFDESTEARPFANSVMHGWHSMIESWDWEKATESRLSESAASASAAVSKDHEENTYRLDSSTKILTIKSGCNTYQFFNIS